MIAFVSFFFGLVTGIKPVEIGVSGRVTEIELRLDGEVVGGLREEPWVLACDFGSELTTHELTAIARGPGGEELDRAVQWINNPRPNVDSQLLLDDWQAGRPRTARVIWQSVEPVEPSSVSLVLDGKVLADEYLERYTLPDIDLSSIHFLSLRLDFPNSLFSSTEVIFGGILGSSTETDLTAVPLRVGDQKLRRLEQLKGRFENNGEQLRAVALGDSPAEVVIVRDRRAFDALLKLNSTYSIRRDYYVTGLAKGDAALFMSSRAFPAIQPDTQYAVYPVSPPMTSSAVPLPRKLWSIRFDRRRMTRQRLTDAVATAGLRAAAGQRRRAVVLVLQDCDDMSGQWSQQAVRDYLAQLRVPLSVWLVQERAARAPAPAAGSFCADAQPIHDVRLLHAAIKRLRGELASQQIVWVGGRHLQRMITFAGEEPGVELVD